MFLKYFYFLIILIINTSLLIAMDAPNEKTALLPSHSLNLTAGFITDFQEALEKDNSERIDQLCKSPVSSRLSKNDEVIINMLVRERHTGSFFSQRTKGILNSYRVKDMGIGLGCFTVFASSLSICIWVATSDCSNDDGLLCQEEALIASSGVAIVTGVASLASCLRVYINSPWLARQQERESIKESVDLFLKSNSHQNIDGP